MISRGKDGRLEARVQRSLLIQTEIGRLIETMMKLGSKYILSGQVLGKEKGREEREGMNEMTKSKRKKGR